MAELTQLGKIKLLLGITSNTKDDLLEELITEVEEFIVDYTHQSLEDISSSLINQIVVYRYNMLGTEGLNSESYSGVSFNYSSELPSNVLKQLNKIRKVLFK